MATNASSHPLNPYPDSIGSKQLSIALISPSMERRAAAALALARCSGGEVNEFTSYPPGLDDLPGMLDQKFDVVIIDLDSDPEFALELVESIGADGMATVMVYSEKRRSGAAGALHARRSARVSDASAGAGR